MPRANFLLHDLLTSETNKPVRHILQGSSRTYLIKISFFKMPNRFLVYVLGHALQGEQVSVHRETCSAYYTAHSEYE